MIKKRGPFQTNDEKKEVGIIRSGYVMVGPHKIKVNLLENGVRSIDKVDLDRFFNKYPLSIEDVKAIETWATSPMDIQWD